MLSRLRPTDATGLKSEKSCRTIARLLSSILFKAIERKEVPMRLRSVRARSPP